MEDSASTLISDDDGGDSRHPPRTLFIVLLMLLASSFVFCASWQIFKWNAEQKRKREFEITQIAFVNDEESLMKNAARTSESYENTAGMISYYLGSDKKEATFGSLVGSEREELRHTLEMDVTGAMRFLSTDKDAAMHNQVWLDSNEDLLDVPPPPNMNFSRLHQERDTDEDPDILMEYEKFLLDCLNEQDRGMKKHETRFLRPQDLPMVVVDPSFLGSSIYNTQKNIQWPQFDVEKIDTRYLCPPGWQMRKVQQVLYATRGRIRCRNVRVR